MILEDFGLRSLARGPPAVPFTHGGSTHTNAFLTPPVPSFQVCRKIWLGLFDARTSLIPDSRDPQKVKEFLQEKYEKKRW